MKKWNSKTENKKRKPKRKRKNKAGKETEKRRTRLRNDRSTNFAIDRTPEARGQISGSYPHVASPTRLAPHKPASPTRTIGWWEVRTKIA